MEEQSEKNSTEAIYRLVEQTLVEKRKLLAASWISLIVIPGIAIAVYFFLNAQIIAAAHTLTSSIIAGVSALTVGGVAGYISARLFFRERKSITSEIETVRRTLSSPQEAIAALELLEKRETEKLELSDSISWKLIKEDGTTEEGGTGKRG